MPNSFDDKSSNRYGFHTNASTTMASIAQRESAGVSVEFVHTRIVEPLDKLIRPLSQATKVAKATSSNSAANILAESLLGVCKKTIENSLSGNPKESITPEPSMSMSR